jgi:hypothetical protein
VLTWTCELSPPSSWSPRNREREREPGLHDRTRALLDSVGVRQPVAPVSGARIELRLEAFNLFNRVDFLAPNANRSLTTFGTITGTYPPRQIQLGAKVSW